MRGKRTGMEKISIIIPVYNGEKYIERCILSASNQTYKNIEIMIIDDGSNDGTADIIEQMMQKDRRIKVIKKKNEGVSSARNCGIKKSTGDYIMFVDTDDYIENDYLRKMYDEIKKYDVDMVCSGYVECDKGESKQVLLEKKLLSGCTECYNYFFECKNVRGTHNASVVWGKLYKRKIISDMKFEGLSYGEDTLFIAGLWGKNIKVLNCDFA